MIVRTDHHQFEDRLGIVVRFVHILRLYRMSLSHSWDWDRGWLGLVGRGEGRRLGRSH